MDVSLCYNRKSCSCSWSLLGKKLRGDGGADEHLLHHSLQLVQLVDLDSEHKLWTFYEKPQK